MEKKSITPGQRKQIVRLLEDGFGKISLSSDAAQEIIKSGDVLHTDLNELIYKLTKFADEEVTSDYGYPGGYKVKGITEQTNILRRLFPGIGFANERIAENPLPDGAEGWFAIPKWQTLAPTYGEAVEKVNRMIGRNRFFCDSNYGETGPEHLRQHEKTLEAFQLIDYRQGGYDILVVPSQFGFRHKGRSIRRARAVMSVNEFGLGAFAVGCMLLTHLERLVQWEQLQIDCAGDEFCLEAYSGFNRAPFFNNVDDDVRFGTRCYELTEKNYGSASGFMP